MHAEAELPVVGVGDIVTPDAQRDVQSYSSR